MTPLGDDKQKNVDGRATRAIRDFNRNHRDILNAATELIDGNTPRSLTVAAVAKRSGFSSVTVHKHFPGGRAEIVGIIVSQILARGTQKYVQQAPTLSGEEHPRAVLFALVDEFLSNKNLVIHSVSMSIELADENAWIPDSTGLAWHSIEMAEKTIKLPATVAELATLMTTFFRGALYAWCLHSISDEEFKRLAVQSFDVAIAAAEAGHHA
ncbi:MAG: TetR/AcrR family transcriptional regulator [Acidimicrobiales bacterium]|nr:TetR/AcrR family transcriptional regulator [Acidimicrobiales bacterium]